MNEYSEEGYRVRVILHAHAGEELVTPTCQSEVDNRERYLSISKAMAMLEHAADYQVIEERLVTKWEII